VRKERGKNMLPEPIKRNCPPKMCILIGVHDQSAKLETALKTLLESAKANEAAVEKYEALGESPESEFITAHTTRLDEIDALVGEVSSKLEDLQDLWLKR